MMGIALYQSNDQVDKGLAIDDDGSRILTT